MIPAEGVFEVVEVKASLNSARLRTYDVAGQRARVRSANPLVDYRPPALAVLAFKAPRLETVLKAYDDLSREYQVSHSTSTYSSRSPGRTNLTERTFLVEGVWVLGSGCVYNILTNELMIGRYGEFTLGMFLTGMLPRFNDFDMGDVEMTAYLNYYLMLESRTVGERVSQWNRGRKRGRRGNNA